MADLTSDFPREELLNMRAAGVGLFRHELDMMTRAIAAYDALSDRYVLDTTELKAEVGNLRAEIQRLRALGKRERSNG